MSAIAERDGRKRAYPIAAGVAVTPNTPYVLVAGYLNVVTAGAGAGISAGVSTLDVDNTNGSAGQQRAEVVVGEHKFGNAGDITVATVGSDCYFVTDAQVSSDSNTGARNKAGKVTQVDTDGVWVQVGV
jgi:hypothetical protein